jgi:hypothetical protein
MYKINMKQFYQMIRSRIEKPTGVDVIIAVIITFLVGNLTGEIVSREFNSYIQASMLLGTVYLAFITMRMTGVWVYEYIQSKK